MVGRWMISVWLLLLLLGYESAFQLFLHDASDPRIES